MDSHSHTVLWVTAVLFLFRIAPTGSPADTTPEHANGHNQLWRSEKQARKRARSACRFRVSGIVSTTRNFGDANTPAERQIPAKLSHRKEFRVGRGMLFDSVIESEIPDIDPQVVTEKAWNRGSFSGSCSRGSIAQTSLTLSNQVKPNIKHCQFAVQALEQSHDSERTLKRIWQHSLPILGRP
ncbi:hypothetical protein C8R44DRAFT_736079 [Mycena epipterygia]|nr:hypothetical protein C8R44DRAFT_736079 [Mycena epipterygia]